MADINDDNSERIFKGLRYGSGVVGKGLFRVRDEHIAGHLLTLIHARSPGAAKLDLLLRGIALLPEHAGQRAPGTVLPKISWETLHDLVRESSQGADPKHLDSSPEVRKLKRKWVNDNLGKLEEMGLVERDYTGRAGRRPLLRVLRDDGSGDPFDDPTGNSGRYTSILGGIFSSRAIVGWNGRTLAAYMAAMYAEHHNPPTLQKRGIGAKRWFRSAAWFSDIDGSYGPEGRVKLPIPTASLIKGLNLLEDKGLLSHERILVSPVNGQRLQGPRNIYTNNFLSLSSSNALMAEQLYKENLQRQLKEDDDLDDAP